MVDTEASVDSIAEVKKSNPASWLTTKALKEQLAVSIAAGSMAEAKAKVQKLATS